MNLYNARLQSGRSVGVIYTNVTKVICTRVNMAATRGKLICTLEQIQGSSVDSQCSHLLPTGNLDF